MNLLLAKYSFGVGDRFARQAKAQLRACMLAAQQGVEIVPVWNKSHREHLIVGSAPGSVRTAAEAAVRELGWTKPFHIDADHVTMETVDGFVEASDFFTMDVAAAIGTPPASADADRFLERHPELLRSIILPGRARPLAIARSLAIEIVRKYLFAAQTAGRIYRHIAAAKGPGNFITEVSMDETDAPQTPVELLLILAALSDEGIPLQTIAPKFTGRFNKGVDYVGDVAQFEKEFSDDLAVIAHARQQYGLPANLKLSVHSGSDKFSIYASIRRALRKTGAGVHVKTAGTTWLEELIGLAEAGGEGLRVAQEVYAEAYAHREALCEPYAAVIDIQEDRLPAPAEVQSWDVGQFLSALRHDPSNPYFNRDLRQLLHVGYKIAAGMGEHYLRMVEECEATISRNVTYNLFQRHICPLFLAEP